MYGQVVEVENLLLGPLRRYIFCSIFWVVW